MYSCQEAEVLDSNQPEFSEQFIKDRDFIHSLGYDVSDLIDGGDID